MSFLGPPDEPSKLRIRHSDEEPLFPQEEELKEEKTERLQELASFLLSAWRRDLVVFLLGAILGTFLFFCSRAFNMHGTADGQLPPCTGGLGDMSDDFNELEANKTLGHRYAFVQMAYDRPDSPPKHIWQVLAMARAVQRFSAFPLVVLTNTTLLPDGTALANVLRRLNVQMLPVQEVRVPSTVRQHMNTVERIRFWKIQIWRLTQFEKLIWLDADAILVRSMDWLFERAPMWGQRDNWMCDATGAEDWLCSGLMLIEPSEETFRGLHRFAAKRSNRWWTRGVQKLIGAYFRYELKRPVRLLDAADASFGKCLGRTPNIPYESEGPWSIPSFVHKSSWNNQCFYFDLDKQVAVQDGKVVNTCNYHPLGSFWRDLFCDALKTIEVKMNATEMFCDDYRWYRKA